jgi:peroxiredoxin Q/BCP
MVAEGAQAPNFTLPDETGTPVRLSSFRGRKVVLWFYVRDDTPG